MRLDLWTGGLRPPLNCEAVISKAKATEREPIRTPAALALTLIHKSDRLATDRMTARLAGTRGFLLLQEHLSSENAPLDGKNRKR